MSEQVPGGSEHEAGPTDEALTAARAVWTDPGRPVPERVEALLAVMTPAEKAAQLGSYWADERDSDQIIAPMQDVLSGGRPDYRTVVAHGIGHLTRVFGAAPVPAEQGMSTLAEAQRVLQQETRLAVPAIAHEECLTGFTTLGATVYPTALAWAATFDTDLVGEMAGAIGQDLAAVGVHQGLSPVLDVVTDYRWGRVEETLGEDPYLVGTMAAAYVAGLERAGVVATLKHFAGHATSRGGRNHAPVSMGRRELADLVLPPFEMALRVGARSVMNSYTELDRVPAAADRWLLTELLRDQWGFTGTVVSDYWAVAFLAAKHRVAASLPEAARTALHAGIDVELPDIAGYAVLDVDDPDPARTAADVDTAVRRVLQQKVELGLLDAGWSSPDPEPVDLDGPGNRALARRLAEESVVLLEDEQHLLPLEGGARRLALIGPAVVDHGCWMGAYSYPVHVLGRHPELGTGLERVLPEEAFAEALPGWEVLAHQGSPLTGADPAMVAEAAELAASADVAVLLVGDRAGMFGAGTSGEGSDAPDLDLPGHQLELVEAVLATGTPVVLVVLSGRPYALGRLTGRGAALVQAFFLGVEGAPALARVLTGAVEVSGRLPVQVPRSGDALPHTYLAPPLGQDGDRISSLSIAPAFPFGHGLSYTTSEVAPPVLEQERVGTDGRAVVRTRVTNTGGRRGVEVVQLYVDDPVAQVTRPVQQLLGFARVELDPGASAEVVFDVHTDRFSFVGLAGDRVVEPGELMLSVGRSVADLAGTATLVLEGPVRTTGPDRVLHTDVTVHPGG
ncbi:glycoside hydrolase family 3 N-terminal domain-containing protein [Auraticoccus monumenti]|uniref:Beta-glucosidase n=1 Tax=Auraticoccus monumenti TaxID=675864 RepID=A0A1G7AS87_9ACTN|nr:glycoside hydrolase family 3 N-terminal domain-containing protein [Auraticoccus monumenti]SDE17738.1 beta-glucosidase [Auraticoccus monumenti]